MTELQAIMAEMDDQYIVTCDRGTHRVLLNGRVVRTFRGPDAACRAIGYALAMMEGRIRGATT